MPDTGQCSSLSRRDVTTNVMAIGVPATVTAGTPTFTTVYKACAGIADRFIVNAKCVVDVRTILYRIQRRLGASWDRMRSKGNYIRDRTN